MNRLQLSHFLNQINVILFFYYLFIWKSTALALNSPSIYKHINLKVRRNGRYLSSLCSNGQEYESGHYKAVVKLPVYFDEESGYFREDDEAAGAFVIVDPFCDFLGQRFSKLVRSQGYASIEVISDYLLQGIGNEDLKYLGAPGKNDEDSWASELPFPIVAVVSESDAGLETAERLQVAFNALGNGFNMARRNKYLMNKAIQDAGIMAVNQTVASCWSEALSFVDNLEKSNLDSFSCIIKPLRGCSSRDVFLCKSKQEAKEMFGFILGKACYGGGINEQVLLQNFIIGQEYAVDTVSSDGIHKVVALWEYDKRPANGAPFVYYSTILTPVVGGILEGIVSYAFQVLDILNIRFGPAHIEIIQGTNGPALVEINCRWHLADVAILTDECVGYNAVGTTLDCFINKEKFNNLPAYPLQLKKSGRLVHLVSEVEGRLDHINHLEEIEALRSVVRLEIFPEFQVGQVIPKTVDIKTDAGVVFLLHKDPQIVNNDYNKILELQKTMFSVDSI